MGGKPVTVGFVGVGRWANVLAEAVQRSNQLTVGGCYARSSERREEFAQKYGCRAFPSLEALLEDPGIEAVVVVTPNNAHAEVIEAAAAHGKPVFVEKPIANTLADAVRIKRACEKAKIPLAVGHSARRLKGIRRIKAMLDSGDLGDLVLVETNFSNDRAWDLKPGQWRFYRDENPGGPLIQLGVHHVDTLHYLGGPIDRVQAFVKRLYTPAEVEDVAAVICEFSRGPLAYIGSAWVTPGVFWVRVYGTKTVATYSLDFRWWARANLADRHSQLVVEDPGKANPEEVPLEQGDMFVEELEDFAQVVRMGGKPEVGLEEGIAVVAVAEAALRSAQTGQVQPVQPLFREFGVQ